MSGHGVRSQSVLDYSATVERIAGMSPPDWTELSAFVAVDSFERVGTFLEVQDWPQYVDMLNRWSGSIERFETALRRITETGDLVFLEIEERHFRGREPHVVNSLTVFEFDGSDRICHLDVYLQQRGRGDR